MTPSDHVTEAYLSLQERLNKGAEGAPVADELFEIFQILFTEEEALVGSKMPLLPSDFNAIAEATGMESEKLGAVLESMTDKGLVIDVPREGGTWYALAPPVMGFLEYTFMKRNEHLPMKRLAELVESYLSKHLLPEEAMLAQTQRARVVPYASAFGEMTSAVATYEQVREMIETSDGGALTQCFCRRQAHLIGKGCDVPVEDICMGLGRGADYLIRHGFGRPATKEELLAKLDEAESMGLVHTTDNVQNKPVFICNCCGCCCHLLRSINEANDYSIISPSRYIAQSDEDACSSCGVCEERCQVKAITIDDGPSRIDQARCIGCGACVAECPSEAITLVPRDAAPEPPKNIKELFTRLVQEKGRIQHYLG